MAKRDPRMSKLNDFINTIHGPEIPDNLLTKVKLPEGFTVLIIGAGEGIGEFIARQYAQAAASRIILTARGRQNLEVVRDEIRKISEHVHIDLTTSDISSASEMADLVKFVQDATQGRLDCVIVNAAYAPPVLLKTHLDEPENVQRAFNVNAMGTFHAAHFFVPMLLASQQGQGAKQFIAIGSMAAQIRRGIIANMGYCVSKMAQTRMVEYLTEQYADQGLWTVIVHPGAVNTSMAKGNTPEAFIPYLTDNVELCGAYCVSMSEKVTKGELKWLNGRFISVTWDFDEFVKKEQEIVEGDLLKFSLMLE